MDFSIKNIQSKKNLNFTGLKGALDVQNNQVFRFVAPPHKKDENVTLEVALLDFNDELGELERPSDDGFIDTIIDNNGQEKALNFDSTGIIDIPQKDFTDLTSGFAYRYKITDKQGNFLRYELDKSKTTPIQGSKEKANIISAGANYGVTPKTGNMYHIYKDSYGIVDEANKKLQNPQGSDFVRNHFNRLGGSTKGILYVLKNTDELAPYRYIMSTPDIGADNTSSHGYWPNNLYQSNDIEAFEDLNVELFKQGKGYIADGAFTSQSLQSPILHHVLKWGKQSPFYNMLKIDGKLKLGILPNIFKRTPEALNNVAVRVVNNPYRINYDKTKPTYMQFYDKRLASNEQLRDNTKLIEKYGKAPEDHYEITTNNDSVYPFYFELDPRGEKIKTFSLMDTLGYKEIIKNQPDFFDFENFTVTDRADASGATFWSGNRDLVKLNLSNPDLADRENIQGMKNARNYLYGVATFWTEDIQSKLILEAAKLPKDELKKVALANDISSERFNEIEKNIDTSSHLTLEEGKTIQDYVKAFPLQSIETSPELSAIFAQPSFNAELFDPKTLEYVVKTVNSILDGAIPDQYKDNDEYKQYVVKTFANKAIKTVLSASMGPAVLDSKNRKFIKENVKNVSLPSMMSAYPIDMKDERDQVVAFIKNNMGFANLSDFSMEVKNELKGISLEDFKLAESIVEQSRAGLNWRFDAAKDIGDMDSVGRSVGSSAKSFSDIWDGENGVEAFWTNFIDEIRKYNPSAYIISEITDFWSFNNQDGTNYSSFDPKIANANRTLYPEGTPFEREIPRLKEARFLENSGSTTSSNYEACFNNLSKFIGVQPEDGSDVSSASGDVKALKDKIDQFIGINQPNIALLSHTFVDNHDKPRLAHCLPLNMQLFLSKSKMADNEEYRKLALQLTQRPEKDINNICSEAVAVGDMFNRQIDRTVKSEDEKQALKMALQDLVNGRKAPKEKPNFKRALAFGVAPYEVTIRDLFKNSGIYYTQEDLDKFHYGIMKDSLKGLVALNEMMCAITGTPTIFNGTEFAQTGYETSSKNAYVGNRGIIRHDLKDNPFYKDFYNQMTAVSSMYQKPELSAIRNGFPVSLNSVATQKLKSEELKDVDNGRLKYQLDLIMSHGGFEALDRYFKKGDIDKDTMKATFGIWYDNFDDFVKYYKTPAIDIEGNPVLDDSGKPLNHFEAVLSAREYNKEKGKDVLTIWPLYKYDENGSRVLSLITNNRLQGNKLSKDNNFEPKECKAPFIEIKDKDGSCPIEDGTILRKLEYDGKSSYVDSPIEYVVKDGKLQRKDGEPLSINDTVETFYVPKKSRQQAQLRANYHNY